MFKIIFLRYIAAILMSALQKNSHAVKTVYKGGAMYQVFLVIVIVLSAMFNL